MKRGLAVRGPGCARRGLEREPAEGLASNVDEPESGASQLAGSADTEGQCLSIGRQAWHMPQKPCVARQWVLRASSIDDNHCGRPMRQSRADRVGERPASGETELGRPPAIPRKFSSTGEGDAIDLELVGIEWDGEQSPFAQENQVSTGSVTRARSVANENLAFSGPKVLDLDILRSLRTARAEQKGATARKHFRPIMKAIAFLTVGRSDGLRVPDFARDTEDA